MDDTQGRETCLFFHKAVLMWGLLAFFSFFQFFIQTSGSFMGEAWQHDFHLSNSALGLLSSSFFYSYMIIQVLAGFLYDHWGARRVARIAILIFSLGLLGFAVTHSLVLAVLARILMGIGAGFAFVGMVYVAVNWFSARFFILFVGLGEMLSMFLTSLGQWFAPAWVLSFGWRPVILSLSLVSFIYFFLIYFLLQDPPKFQAKKGLFLQSFWLQLKKVSQNKVVWLAGFYCGGLFAVITLFASLWGSFFLEQVDGFSYLDATRLIALIPFGFALGGPFFGFINERYIRPGSLVCVTSFVLFILILGILFLNHSFIFTLVSLVLMGFLGGANVLSFYMIEHYGNVAAQFRGTAIGLCNGLAIFMGAVFQSLIGFLFHYQAKWAMLPFPLFVFLAFMAAVILNVNQRTRSN